MPEGYGYDKEGIIQFLIDKFAGAPDVQAPPSQVRDPLNRFGELRRPQRGRGGPRNTESAASVMGPEGQRSTRRRTRGMIDHSKRLPDIPGDLAGLDPSLRLGILSSAFPSFSGLGGAVGGRLTHAQKDHVLGAARDPFTESDIRSAERKLPQRRGPAPVGYANPRTR